MAIFQGSCHCERVRFEVTGELEQVTECNCSICRRKAYLHWIVPRDAFRLLAGEDAIETYRFNTGVAQHRFCRHCGVAGFYVPRSHPDCIDVNVRCLPDVDLDALTRRAFDGRNWEAHVAEFRERDAVARAAGSTSTPAEHPNAARVRALFAAFRNGDLATVQATIPEDAVWHFPGRAGKLAGSHRGREAILRFLLSVPALTGGTFHLELEDVIANDRRAVALFRGSGTREGRTLDNPTTLVMRIADGQVVEVHEFVWDLFHVDAFWS
jgi:ketosteroid isomerase-like protein